MNIEIIRNVLYKSYLEDFYSYCQKLGEPTASIMGDILKVHELYLVVFTAQLIGEFSSRRTVGPST